MAEHDAHPPVARVSEVYLDLGATSHGWLPFVLRFADYAIEDAASFVLNNPVDELIDLLQFLGAVASGFSRTCLWLEPAGYALDVAHRSAEDCGVTVRYDDSFMPPMAGHAMSTVHRCIVPTGELRRALHQALESLFARAIDPKRRDDLESLRHKWKHVRDQIEAPWVMRAAQIE